MKSFATMVCAVAALVSPCAAGGDHPRKATEVVETTLTAIRGAPESFKGVSVAFRVQFASIGTLQNPFFTRFVASDFANFYAWSDDQPIWRRTEYDDVFGLLFLSKEHEQLDDVFHLEAYDRLEVRGVVRNTFQGMPWIEVTGFQRVGGKVNTATLTHLYRGEQHMEESEWSRAISELSLAPAGEVPKHVRAAVHKNIGVCYLRMGEQQVALGHFNSAAALGKDREIQRLVTVAESRPGAGLDRSVNRQAVRDDERPLWEAFYELDAVETKNITPLGRSKPQ